MRVAMAEPSSGGKKRKAAEIDEAAWCRLPDDLLVQVLLCLPIRDLLRAAAVCLRWRSITKVPAFRASWSQMARHRETYYLPYLASASPPTVCLAFSPAEQRWLSMPDLTFLYPSVSFSCTSTGVFESIHRGLFCKWNYRKMSPALVVCNPVTRECRTLPPLEEERNFKAEYCSTHLRVAEDGNSFTVIVVKSCGDTLQVWNFDSVSNSWTLWFCSSSEGLALIDYANSVYRDGVIYVVGHNTNPENDDSSNYCLFSYNVQARVWSKVCELPDDEKLPMVVECASGIMVVTSNTLVYRKGLTVYNLDSCSGQLNEIAQMPVEFDQFWKCFHSEYQMCFLHPVGLGDLICFPTLSSKQALIFNTSLDTWSYWPSGPFNWPDRPQDRQNSAPIPPLWFPVSLSFLKP